MARNYLQWRKVLQLDALQREEDEVSALQMRTEFSCMFFILLRAQVGTNEIFANPAGSILANSKVVLRIEWWLNNDSTADLDEATMESALSA